MFDWLKRLFGDSNQAALREMQPWVDDVNALAPEFKELTDDELRAKTDEFRQRLSEGETLDDLLPEAFAAIREAAHRTIGQFHFDVQVIGGLALHQGKIAEMRTGEGKTLVATLPLYLNALEGKGCHLVTVNDYLARVGAGWMAPIYYRLGLQAGVIGHEYSALYDPNFIDPNANKDDDRLIHWRPCTRREAYHADITYGTNNEFGFDYLRDNMAGDMEQVVQRELNFAIVDEVDNILIDEARTPLIISGRAEKSSEEYRRMARLIRGLKRCTVSAKDIRDGVDEADGDYIVDEKSRSISLTDQGIAEVEHRLHIPEDESLYDPKHYELTHFLENALRAEYIYLRDKDYVVTPEKEVVIVDEFTGRLMPGRRWSDGLHQAVEAKEGVPLQHENVTMATITFQNFFRMYNKLAGMTGTAYTEREELGQIYNLDVVVIPTNRAVIRDDQRDQVYRTEEAKFAAIVREVQELSEVGRPILIGTTSVETSERLSEQLRRSGITHNVLNAKQHEREAAIVAQAGRLGAVTVSTNMAGRGTDILLGGNADGIAADILAKKVKGELPTEEQKAQARAEADQIIAEERGKVIELGGLHVLGTERHESRRIDNQLRGRAGRQGDPGSSRFFLSLEDELMRRFGSMDRIKSVMGRLSGGEDDIPIESRILDKAIEGAQTRVEGYNFDIRKHTVQFDDVVNKQRHIIYADRRAILEGEDMHERVLEMIGEEIAALIDRNLPDTDQEHWDVAALVRAYRDINPVVPADFTDEDLLDLGRDQIEERLISMFEEVYAQREQALGKEQMRLVERQMMLGAIDRQWVDYLTGVDDLRQSISLEAFAQRDPLVEFKRKSYQMFDELKNNITRDIVYNLLSASFQHEAILRAIELEQQQRMEMARHAGEEKADRSAPRTLKRTLQMPGRNDPCPCGSGKKFKHCHLGREQEIMPLLQGAPAPAAIAPTLHLAGQNAQRIVQNGGSAPKPAPQTNGNGDAEVNAQASNGHNETASDAQRGKGRAVPPAPVASAPVKRGKGKPAPAKKR